MDQVQNQPRPVRRFTRYHFETRVAILRQGRFQISRSVELSEGGMLIASPVPLALGERLEVNFFLANQDFISAFAEVIYILKPDGTGCGVGLKFIDLPIKAQAAIRDFSLPGY